MTRASLLSGAAMALACAVTASPSAADAPRVVADIAPVHGLIARVMEGVGEPDLLVPPGASPHSYALRPSQARDLSEAQAVFWVGHELAPWLEDTVGELAKDAHVIELLEAEGTLTLAFREGATFAEHDHGDAHDEEGHEDHDDDHHADHDDHEGHDHDEHGHDDDHADHGHEDHGHDDHGHKDDDHGDEHGHEDHDHDAHHDEHDHEDHHEGTHEEHDHADHEDHDGHHDEHEGHDHDEHDHEDHDDHAGHDHHGVDPHAWLAPENGKVWLSVIAAELSEIDPANAETYAANAAAGQAEIDATVAALRTELAPLKAQGFIVFHDAYQYFEQAFDLAALGSISIGDASDPSVARIAELREAVAEFEPVCVFSEPQFNAGLVSTVIEGSNANTALLDPLGLEVAQGANFYTDLLKTLGASFTTCLSEG